MHIRLNRFARYKNVTFRLLENNSLTHLKPLRKYLYLHLLFESNKRLRSNHIRKLDQ